jgi:hypothetical protein
MPTLSAFASALMTVTYVCRNRPSNIAAGRSKFSQGCTEREDKAVPRSYRSPSAFSGPRAGRTVASSSDRLPEKVLAKVTTVEILLQKENTEFFGIKLLVDGFTLCPRLCFFLVEVSGLNRLAFSGQQWSQRQTALCMLIHALPLEVILHILSFLNSPEELIRLRLVCRQFHRAVSNCNVSLSIRRPLSISALKNLIHIFPSVSALHLPLKMAVPEEFVDQVNFMWFSLHH